MVSVPTERVETFDKCPSESPPLRRQCVEFSKSTTLSRSSSMPSCIHLRSRLLIVLLFALLHFVAADAAVTTAAPSRSKFIRSPGTPSTELIPFHHHHHRETQTDHDQHPSVSATMDHLSSTGRKPIDRLLVKQPQRRDIEHTLAGRLQPQHNSPHTEKLGGHWASVGVKQFAAIPSTPALGLGFQKSLWESWRQQVNGIVGTRRDSKLSSPNEDDKEDTKDRNSNIAVIVFASLICVPLLAIWIIKSYRKEQARRAPVRYVIRFNPEFSHRQRFEPHQKSLQIRKQYIYTKTRIPEESSHPSRPVNTAAAENRSWHQPFVRRHQTPFAGPRTDHQSPLNVRRVTTTTYQNHQTLRSQLPRNFRSHINQLNVDRSKQKIRSINERHHGGRCGSSGSTNTLKLLPLRRTSAKPVAHSDGNMDHVVPNNNAST